MARFDENGEVISRCYVDIPDAHERLSSGVRLLDGRVFFGSSVMPVEYEFESRVFELMMP